MVGPAGFQRAAVLGTGMMGPGIAMLLAYGGVETTIVSRSATGAEAGLAKAVAALRFWQEHDLVTTELVAATQSRLLAANDRAGAVRDVDLVVESIVEDLGTKQALFVELDRETRPDALLCTNTSGLRITDIARDMTHPERAYTTHFWNPPHLVPLVEIMVGDRSDVGGAERLRTLFRACGKRPVVGLKDIPGQLGNRLQHAIIREALYMLETGVASAEDIEESLKAGPGIRWPVYGPFEHNDMVGLELTRAVQAAVIPSLAANTTPATLLDRELAAGHLGVKSGQGHYEWTPERAEAVRKRRDEFLLERLRVQLSAAHSGDTR